MQWRKAVSGQLTALMSAYDLVHVPPPVGRHHPNEGIIEGQSGRDRATLHQPQLEIYVCFG